MLSWTIILAAQGWKYLINGIIKPNSTMKTRHILLSTGFLISLGWLLPVEAKEKLPPPAQPIEEIASGPNPTLSLAPPELEKLTKQIENAMIGGTPLDTTLRELLDYAKNYRPPSPADKSHSDATLNLCILARRVTAHYAPYQQTYRSDGLRKDLKDIAEQALLFALKKMEWVAKRETQSADDYFNSYYSTLRRYREISEGWLLLESKWVQVRVCP